MVNNNKGGDIDVTLPQNDKVPSFAQKRKTPGRCTDRFGMESHWIPNLNEESNNEGVEEA